uniref:Protein TIC 214 n=1 Tax=Biscutella sempervirens subsp. vicentina TaxID=264432 RepID=A0A6M8YJ47_9BRAS|nr:Ycf1.2 [Biscutella vincentina]QKK39237.1 Ycf1.2 [Biscutella vincentina]
MEQQSKIDEKRRIKTAETWNRTRSTQPTRGCLLLTQSILRKYIILPLLIIIKNSVRMLLFQIPEWSEDLKDWKREMHIKCTYNGVPLSATEFPRNWLREGIQIKIIFPFYLKPWHKYKFKSSQKVRLKKTKDKREKNDFCFLTVSGMETELPFGYPKKKPSFFKPIFKELKKRIKKLKPQSFRVLRILKERATIFLKVEKEIKNWIIQNCLFIKGKRKNLSKQNLIPLFGPREIYELNKKDSIMSNQIIHERSVQKKTMEWTNSSLSENKIKNLIDRIKTIRNQTEEISKEKENLTNSFNKPRYDLKIMESSKKNWQTFKRRNTRLISKSVFFIKFRIEQLSIAIFLGIINIPRITTQLFFESTKTIFDKYIYKNEENGKKIKNQKNTISFISTIKNLIFNKKKIRYHLGSLSQAYVFYKLAQIKVSTFSKLKAVLEYNICITSFFVKNKIKDFFQEQGILHYELKDKTLFNSEENRWKSWLRSHYQYHLPQIAWARLVTKKWKNKINQDSLVLNPSLTKEDSSEKTKFDNYKYKKHNFFETDSLFNRKHNLKKDSIYNLFCYKSIHSTEKNFDMSRGILLDNCLVSYFLEKYNSRSIREIWHRKYLDWRILHFLFRKKVNIEAWVDITSKKNYIKTKVQNYQRIDKKIQTDLANKKSFFFDWMGMNEEILIHRITNFESFVFPEFFLFSSTYKNKPWVIPIKLLLFNFNENLNGNNGFIPSNKKKTIKENYAKWKIKKRKNQKQYKRNTEAELYLVLRRYSHFQLRWKRLFEKEILKNIKVYILLLRLKNLKEVALSSIEQREMNLDILMMKKNLTLGKLMKNRIFIIEPARLSVKNDGQLIIYRTIGISLVHKNKQKISNRYKKKSYIDKQKMQKSITKYQNKTVNRKKKNYDFFVPENILSPKRRREFRILICFNFKKKNARDINSRFDKNIKNLTTVLHKTKDLDRDKNNLIKLKSFLWPNFRLEDLACMNRYWFNTTNGNHFSIIRIHMYTRFQIH